MAKTTRSLTAAKAQKGKTSTKARDVKTGKSKPAVTKGRTVKKAPAKAMRAVAKPAKKAAAKKTVVKAVGKKPTVKAKPASKKIVAKPAARKAVAKQPPKKVAKVVKPVVKKAAAKQVAVKKTAPKKIAVKKVPASKVVVKKTVAKPAPKPAAKKVAVPTKPAAKAAAKPISKPNHPVAKPAPVETVKSVSPSPASSLFKGKVASATAMVTPRAAPASERHDSSHKNQKNSSSSMNKLATKKLDNGVVREDGRYALSSTSNVTLPKGYHPSSNEEYMNPQHLAYFRNKLRDWRDQLVEESRQTMDNLRDEVRDVGDEAERATRETENSLELRTRDRYRKLISKIDKALRRIEEGSYGFCEETDEEIGVDRLDARPIATLSLDAQERREHLQKQMGD